MTVCLCVSSFFSIHVKLKTPADLSAYSCRSAFPTSRWLHRTSKATRCSTGEPCKCGPDRRGCRYNVTSELMMEPSSGPSPPLPLGWYLCPSFPFSFFLPLASAMYLVFNKVHKLILAFWIFRFEIQIPPSLNVAGI